MYTVQLYSMQGHGYGIASRIGTGRCEPPNHLRWFYSGRLLRKYFSCQKRVLPRPRPRPLAWQQVRRPNRAQTGTAQHDTVYSAGRTGALTAQTTSLLFCAFSIFSYDAAPCSTVESSEGQASTCLRVPDMSIPESSCGAMHRHPVGGRWRLAGARVGTTAHGLARPNLAPPW